MKVCFPVKVNQGLESVVFNHFGPAPVFVVVDTETAQVSEVINRDLHHAHGGPAARSRPSTGTALAMSELGFSYYSIGRR